MCPYCSRHSEPWSLCSRLDTVSFIKKSSQTGVQKCMNEATDHSSSTLESQSFSSLWINFGFWWHIARAVMDN